jgi:hypothetical protein
MKDRIQMLDFSKKLVDFQYSFTKKTNTKYAYYGKDNRLPFYLMQLYKDSPTHSGIIKNKHKFLKGEGFETDFVTNEITGETLSSLYSKIAFDMLVYGGFAIRVVEYKSKNQLYHIDFGKIRVEQTADSLTEPNKFYFSDEWEAGKNVHTIEFPRYGEAPKDSKIGTLFYFYDYNSLNRYYPIPEYFGAVKSIMGEIESQNYLVSVMDNSYMPRNIIKMKQMFTPEEETKLVNKLRNQYEGTDNAGRPIILTNLQDTDSIAIETLDYSMLDPNFTVIDESITQKIVSAHRIPRQLATLNSTTGFSNSGEELRVAFEVFYKTVIVETQMSLVKAIELLTGETVTILPLDIIRVQLSEDTLKEILSTDELRQLYGY